MIATLEKLLDKYHSLGIVKAGELLLRPADALRLAEELEQRKILILGVDVWYYSGDKIAEDPASLDLSEITDFQITADLAKKFIANKLPKITAFVSFVWEEDRAFKTEN